jgi:hypothetical protein
LHLAARIDLHCLWKRRRADLVTCTQVLEHIDDELGAFAELVRILKPAGYPLRKFLFKPSRYEEQHFCIGCRVWTKLLERGPHYFPVSRKRKNFVAQDRNHLKQPVLRLRFRQDERSLVAKRLQSANDDVKIKTFDINFHCRHPQVKARNEIIDGYDVYFLNITLP